MNTFTWGECLEPSRCSGISSKSHSGLTANRWTCQTRIVDNAVTLPLDFAYLVACRPISLFIRSGNMCMLRYIALSAFCRQFEYNHQLPRVFNSRLLDETSLIKANVYWRECMPSHTNSTLEVPSLYQVRNVTVLYARWWHRAAGATCTAIHVPKPLHLKSTGQKRRATASSEQFEDPPPFGQPSPSRGRNKRWGAKHSKTKKGKRPSLAEGSTVGDWTRLVDLRIEGAVVRDPPLKKRKTGS